MAFEEKYEKKSVSYIASFIKRKVINSLLAYPEFLFLLKILIGLIVAFTVFTLFRKTYNLL